MGRGFFMMEGAMKRGVLTALIFFCGWWGAAQAQDHYPDYMKMALKAFQNKNYDLAIGYYESALDDKQDYWPAYQGIGVCYYYKRKNKDALKAFETALKLNPGNARLTAFIDYLRRQLATPKVPGT